ncbi:MAG TPA: GNAT family N-acetyltransferase [Gaiellaceae bacterium]
MSSFLLRHPRPEDAEPVTELIRRLDEALAGASDFTLADLQDEWRKLPPNRDAWVVVDGDVVVGYGTVDDRGDARADGYVHPDHFGRGVGALLVESLEAELRRRGSPFVRNATLLADERGGRLLRSRGYREVRRFWNMRIELTEEPVPPAPPAGCAIETLDVADAEAFHAAYEDAFADHWAHVRRPFDAWRRDHMEGPHYAPELWRLVRCDGEIAAGAFGVWDRSGAAEVARLFTRRPWRRRGLADALLRDAFSLFWRGGRRVVSLGVDATSTTGANVLYERAGMHVHWGAVVFEKGFA